jgi:hypothetical protein
VVGVRVAVLVQPDRVAMRAGAQLGREARVEGGGDDGQVDRQAVRREQVEQLEQPPGAPAGVVVAEEHLHRRGRVVESCADGVEPVGIHTGVTRRRRVA